MEVPINRSVNEYSNVFIYIKMELHEIFTSKWSYVKYLPMKTKYTLKL